MQESKNTFTPNSSNQNIFFKKIWWYTFFLFYLWAKYYRFYCSNSDFR